MGFSQALATCFKKKYLTISGRASRSEFWWFLAFLWGSIILTTASGLSLGKTGFSGGPAMVFLVTISVFYLILIPPTITVMVRRFHDINMSGWWALGLSILNFIPYLGVISSLAMLYFTIRKGTSGDNRFGSDPVSIPRHSPIPLT